MLKRILNFLVLITILIIIGIIIISGYQYYIFITSQPTFARNDIEAGQLSESITSKIRLGNIDTARQLYYATLSSSTTSIQMRNVAVFAGSEVLTYPLSVNSNMNDIVNNIHDLTTIAVGTSTPSNRARAMFLLGLWCNDIPTTALCNEVFKNPTLHSFAIYKTSTSTVLNMSESSNSLFAESRKIFPTYQSSVEMSRHFAEGAYRNSLYGNGKAVSADLIQAKFYLSVANKLWNLSTTSAAIKIVPIQSNVDRDRYYLDRAIVMATLSHFDSSKNIYDYKNAFTQASEILTDVGDLESTRMRAITHFYYAMYLVANGESELAKNEVDLAIQAVRSDPYMASNPFIIYIQENSRDAVSNKIQIPVTVGSMMQSFPAFASFAGSLK